MRPVMWLDYPAALHQEALPALCAKLGVSWNSNAERKTLEWPLSPRLERV